MLIRGVSTMETEMARFDQKLEQIEQIVRESAEVSEAARSRAMEAEQNALKAAEAREQAEKETSAARQAVTNAREETRQARTELEQVRREREAELNRLQEALNRIVETRRTALGLVMNLGTDFIQFPFDKADLDAGDKELLSRIAGILLTSDGYRIQIFGHTDDIGNEQYNQDLSEKRAEAVQNYLVEAGIEREIITTRGFGKSRPLVEGTTSEARAKNRRVEIGIIDARVEYDRTLADQRE